METNPSYWQTTVSELMLIYRDALCALVPVVERAHIGWQDHNAYDDWDNICESLYQNIVLRSLDYSIEVGDHSPVPIYDFRFEDYRENSFIKVISKDLAGAQDNAFIGFSTGDKPFDSVELVLLSSEYQSENRTVTLPIENCDFQMVARKNSDVRHLSSLKVEL